MFVKIPIKALGAGLADKCQFNLYIVHKTRAYDNLFNLMDMISI
jgi:hypothetical protein